MTTMWTVLGFTGDDVVGSQDAPLAQQCAEARRAEGDPKDFEIRRAAGDRVYVFYWYVSDGAARALDAHHVGWRRFQIGCSTSAPQDAASLLGGKKAAQ